MRVISNYNIVIKKLPVKKMLKAINKKAENYNIRI